MSTTPITVLDHAAFEVTLAPGIVADEAFMKRDGQTLVGVAASAITVGAASALVETGGATLTMGAVPNDRVLYRGGDSTITGLAPSTLYANGWSYVDAITEAANVATYDWDTAIRAIAIVHTAATTDVSLPVQSSILNWVPGSPPRKLYKMNGSAFGINLLVAGNCTINGGAAAADMTPIPDSNATPSVTVLAQWVYVYRQSATAYWVFGGQ